MEWSEPALVEADPLSDVTDLLWQHADGDPTAVLMSRRIDGHWHPVTAAAFRDEVVGVARGLVAAGVRQGDRVGLMSATRYEWTLFDFAIWAAGGVVVPIYETSSADQVAWMMSDSGASVLVVETVKHQALVTQLADELTGIRSVWCIDEGGVAALTTAGAEVPVEEISRRRAALRADSVATVIYTSGTTGRPKGCALTHANFRAEVDNIVVGLPEIFEGDDIAALLFLPLAHVLARVVQLVCVAAKVRLGHTSDIKQLTADLAEFRPTFLLTVPRVFEKVYNGSEQRAQTAGKGRIFAAAASTAIAYSEALEPGEMSRWSPRRVPLAARHKLFDRLVYAKLRAALGGRVAYAICGGAPLDPGFAHFFRGIGLTVLEGYGLTETTAAATLNRPRAARIGTVGPPVPGTSIRIAEDGEVLIRGGIVFAGYHGNPGATKEMLDADGWLSTGDLGLLDDDGYLRITGRKKELIVTAGGKNVSPAAVEDRVRTSPIISQCLVVGDGRPYVAALVTLDDEGLAAWLAGKGRPAMSAAEAADDPEVKAAVQAAFDTANATVSRAEGVKRFAILDTDFTEDNGRLTPTLKVKRNVVARELASDIEALYADAGSSNSRS